jgi:hypothetical protein
MIKYKNINWFLHHGVLLPMAAPEFEIELDKQDQQYLLKKTRARFIRWTSEFDKDESSFWYIIKDSFGGMEELSSNTRSKTRRGAKNFTIGPISFEQLKEKGYLTYLNAFQRFSTFEKPMGAAEFRNHVSFLENSGFYEIWGVWDSENRELAGFSENLILGPTCFYETIYFDPSYLKNYSSYALFYEMNRHYLEERGFQYVHDGTRSLSHDTNVQEFLVDKFKFRKAFCKLHIAYRQDIGLLVKVMYPFRNFIYKRNDPVGKRLAVLLRHEEIRRCQ